MALRTRHDYYHLAVGVDTTQIVPASKMVSQITGFAVQPNKAVVGANAFAHASGIHQDGILKARETYEIMRAEDVGWTANKIVLGKLSGRNAFKARLQELGIALDSEAEVNAAFARFKELADRKADIFDEDIMALVSDEDRAQGGEIYRFVSLSQRSETGELPHARIVFTGGVAALLPGAVGGAPAVGAYLEAAGIAPERIVLEEQSRNTYENALLTRELVNPQPGEPWLLVTSAWHMPRAVGAFRQARFDVVPWPVDYRTRGWQDLAQPFDAMTEGLRRTDMAVREWIGLTAYWLLGRSSALFPGPDAGRAPPA